MVSFGLGGIILFSLATVATSILPGRDRSRGQICYVAFMDSEQHTPKQWRPRYSIRMLVVLVTLVCGYTACWGPTRNRGPEDVKNCDGDTPIVLRRIVQADPAAPLIVTTREFHLPKRSGSDTRLPRLYRSYYFWFFGYVARLPYKREIPWPDSRSLTQPVWTQPSRVR